MVVVSLAQDGLACFNERLVKSICSKLNLLCFALCCRWRFLVQADEAVGELDVEYLAYFGFEKLLIVEFASFDRL